LREWQKNTLVSVLSVVCFYSVIEVMVWRRVLDRVPLHLQSELGRLSVFGQTSKNGIVPNDYIMMIGDSYVEGLGDWLLSVVRNGNPRYNAAHILHEATGRDVISVGVRGGHTTLNVHNALRTYTGANLYAGQTLVEPSDIVVAFYAGNDINDEIVNLRYMVPEAFAGIDSKKAELALRLVRQYASSGIEVAERRWHWFRNAHLFDTTTKLVKLISKDFSRDVRGGNSGYIEDWTRYEASETMFFSDGGVLPYAADTVEPFAFHTTEEIEVTALILSSALSVYREHFPNARLWVAHIPSPIIAYKLASPEVTLRNRVREKHAERSGPPVRFSVETLNRESNKICNAMLTAASAAGVGFIDTAPYLRARSEKVGHLHGPNDPSHLNERGYTALGEVLALGLSGQSPAPCALGLVD
jgi:hypothetical protein